MNKAFRPPSRQKTRAPTRLSGRWHDVLFFWESLSVGWQLRFRNDPHSETPREINWPLITSTAIGLLLVGPGLYFWHSHQVRQLADVYLQQAEGFEAEENWPEVSERYFRYLRLRPDDPAIRSKIADAWGKTAYTFEDKQRHVELLQAAITANPKNADLHLKLAQLLYDLESDLASQDQLNHLLALEPNHPAGWRIRALATYRLAKKTLRVPMPVAADALKEAVQLNPRDVQLASTLAGLYREDLQELIPGKRADLADTVMDDLVDASPQDTDALLARYDYRLKYEVPGAEQDLQEVLRLSPDSTAAHLRAGARARKEGKLDLALRHYQQAADLDPGESEAYIGLGECHQQAGDLQRAIDVWRKGTATARADLRLNLQLINTLINQAQLDLAEQEMQVLAETAERIADSFDSAARKEWKDSAAYLRGKWFVAAGQFTKAEPILRSTLTSRESNAVTPEEAEQRVQIHYQLALCFRGQGLPDKAAEQYLIMVRLQPTEAANYLIAAESFEQAEQFEEAIRLYESALRLDVVPPEAYVRLADAELQRQRRLPPDGREWTSFESAIRRGRDAQADAVALTVLEADALAVQGRTADALRLLRDAVEQSPREERLWQASLLAMVRWGRAEDLDSQLQAYETRFSKSLRAALLKGEILARRKQPDAAQKALRAAIPRFPEADQRSLRVQMARLALEAGRTADARLVLREIVEQEQRDPAVLRLLGELAIDENDLVDAEKWEGIVRKVEGQSGTLWRYLKARRHIAAADSAVSPELGLAQGSIEEILALRPSWAPGQVLAGMLAERRQRQGDAIQAYRAALKLGEDNIFVLQRLVALLYQQKRLSEADEVLSQATERSGLSTDMANLAVDLSLKLGDVARALRLAEQAAQEKTDDPFPQLTWGQTLLLADRPGEAERVIRSAVERFPQEPLTWLALTSLLVHTQNEAGAQQVIEQLAQQKELEPGTRTYLLAQAHQLTGNLEQADKFWREALQLSPEDQVVQQRGAAFFSSRDPEVAEEALRRLLVINPASDATRRTLAVMLAQRGGEKNVQESLKLLAEQRNAAEQGSPDDLRARAYVLSQRGGLDERREALRLLEQLVQGEKDVRPEDRIVLAHLYVRDGKIPKAREQYLTLVTGQDPQPGYLAGLIDLLLRHQRPDEAATWLMQLEQMEPNTFRTISLGARWLHAKDRRSEIETKVNNFLETALPAAPTDAQRAALMAEAADLYAAVQNPPAAERYYRDALQLEPRFYEPFAEWLAQQRRTGEAIDVCLNMTGKVREPLPEVVLGVILSRSQASPAASQRAESALAAALQERKDNPTLLLVMANLRYTQGKTDEAIRYYRECLKLAPEHVTALNNLAHVLSDDPNQQAEAVRCIEQAVAVGGPKPTLLDSQALVLLRAGQVDKAVEILKKLTAAPSADAMNFFHLALAHKESDAPDEARWALQQARERDLDTLPMTPSEREQLHGLEVALQQVAPQPAGDSP